MKYKIYLLNFSNYSKKSKFISNFVDEREFSNFMMRTRQRGGLDKGFYGITEIIEISSFIYTENLVKSWSL